MKIIKAIRWTVNKAASEFALGTKGLSSSLKAKNIQPGKDGRFSTQQIVAAIFDSDYEERLRLVKEQANYKALRNAELRESLIDIEEFADSLRVPLEAMRQRILCAYKLLDIEKDEILEDLNALWKCVFVDEPPTRPGAVKALAKAKAKAQRKHHEED